MYRPSHGLQYISSETLSLPLFSSADWSLKADYGGALCVLVAGRARLCLLAAGCVQWLHSSRRPWEARAPSIDSWSLRKSYPPLAPGEYVLDRSGAFHRPLSSRRSRIERRRWQRAVAMKCHFTRIPNTYIYNRVYYYWPSWPITDTIHG